MQEWREVVAAKLDRFIIGENRSASIEARPLTAYVRRSRRITNQRKFLRCLDIATLDVIRNQRQQGYCRAFLQEAEKIAAEYDYLIMVESVSNRHLFKALIGYGYQPFDHDRRSLYKQVTEDIFADNQAKE